MSQQNINDWTDKFGRRLEIGQRVAAVRGKSLVVGKIAWFTGKGVTIEDEDKNGLVKNVPVLYDKAANWSRKDGSQSFLII